MPIVSGIERFFGNDAPRWVVIEQGYKLCSCVDTESRKKNTGSQLPPECPKHPGSRWAWVRTTDAEATNTDART